MECNICGCDEFLAHKKRGLIRCKKCGSIDRTRILALYLEKHVTFRPGLRVLHLAPERPLFPRIAEIVGPSYEIRDLDVARYSKLSAEGISVREFDLCKDCESLPSDRYDLILHNHVMEHLYCNVTAVLWHLHRALAPGGLHMFSIPTIGKRYEETFLDLDEETRLHRFGHKEHVRNFAKPDLACTIGMVFDIEDMLSETLFDTFGEDILRRYNIPEARWHSFNGAQPFVLSKERLKLA